MTLSKRSMVISLAILLAFALGRWSGARKTSLHIHDTDQPQMDSSSRAEVWTCSMHPQIRQPKFGLCPLCGMDLIPVVSDDTEDSGGDWSLRLSERAIRLAEIQTSAVERKAVTTEVRMVGKVDFDEGRVRTIAAWVPGRIDRLFVDYTGVPVRKGEHLVSLYSPELITAQEELLQSIKALSGLKSPALESFRETAQKTTAAAREKLRLWGLTQEQVDEIERTGKTTTQMTITASISGIVIEKYLTEGSYVDVGTEVYQIADLTQVWVRLEAYEQDLSWIRYGQTVEFVTEAYPGETFDGKIAFIDPLLNDETRTVRVRVNADNRRGLLKPGMFVSAVVRSSIAAEGKVMEPSLAGKWICSMHPEIVKQGSGTCDICDMALVRPESLGYVAADSVRPALPLVIPSSAALLTGRRAIVYTKSPDRDGVFQGREVVLGPRAGDEYIVREGLSEGELVVTNGAFKIDSDLQIRAGRSMMRPDPTDASHEHSTPQPDAPTETSSAHVPAAFRLQLDPILKGYFAIRSALAADDLATTRESVPSLLDALDKVNVTALGEADRAFWTKEAGILKRSATAIRDSQDMAKAREQFQTLSDGLTAVAKRLGVSGETPVIRFHCPMAFNNRGAYWLQETSELRNPYFGSAMLRCGTQTEVLSEAKGTQ